MFRRLNERNQITIPPDILESVGAGQGDFFAISAETGKIILEPRRVEAKAYPEADWQAFALEVRDQAGRKEYTEYASPRAAKKHLRKLKK